MDSTTALVLLIILVLFVGVAVKNYFFSPGVEWPATTPDDGDEEEDE